MALYCFEVYNFRLKIAQHVKKYTQLEEIYLAVVEASDTFTWN